MRNFCHRRLRVLLPAPPPPLLPTHHPGEDLRKLENGVHVVSGTPGRVFDMIKRKSLRTRSIKTLVLDEADEMLAKNFKDQIYDIYRYLPPETQVGRQCRALNPQPGGRACAGPGPEPQAPNPAP